ncbi:MAG TPA: family 43 glycosylhydrolase [Pseudomonadales bacterium]
MHTNRREVIRAALAAAGGLAVSPARAQISDAACSSTASSVSGPTWRTGIEGQRVADLGDGTFLNPVLAGDRPDPNVLKDGDDYYVAFSSFKYYPGAPIWHSRDLVNWTPLTAALKKDIGIVCALDIAKHDGRYFIYIPVLDPRDRQRPLKTYVIHADSMAGPWSDPIDMRVDNEIDPGHAVGEDGKRYLFLSSGTRARISDDGLTGLEARKKVYDGWPIPDEYVIEGIALEGPKVLRKDGWFYLFSAQGGTGGPPTSHMVVVARSRSIHGPWENAPNNPIVRTRSRNEPWWSRGHATPVQGPNGDWWLVYHGYENGFRTLGRQMLLEPIEWTADGWPVARGGDLSRPMPKPLPSSKGEHGAPLSGFTDDLFDGKFAFYAPQPDYLDRVKITRERLELRAQGTGPADSSPLVFVAGDRSYEVTVDVEISGEAEGGLLLFYSEKMFAGIGLADGKLNAYKIGRKDSPPASDPAISRRIRLRLQNSENVVTFSYRVPGGRWKKERSFEVAGYNHNVVDGFLSLRPGFFAAGSGVVRFRNHVYRAIEPTDGLLKPMA